MIETSSLPVPALRMAVKPAKRAAAQKPVRLRRLDAPVTLRGQVVQQLRAAIVSGALPPGQKLREVEIATALGVSPTPVREAFAELAAEGLVAIEANRQRRVTPIDVAAMIDLLRVQTGLWRLGYVWALATPQAIDTAALAQALSGFEAALAEGSRLSAMQAAHEFHTIVVQASQSRELLRVTLDRRALMARFIVLHASPLISTASLDEHRAMLDAVRRGDAGEVLDHFDQLSGGLIDLILHRAD